jgi:hypothetical protein
MRFRSAIALLALPPALGACGQLLPGAATNNSAATGNQSAGGKLALVSSTGGGGPISDAGITDSRALGGLNAGASGNAAVPTDPGGKPIAPPPPPVVSAASSSDPIDPAALVGRWGDFGNCAQPIEMRPDGTFATANGGGGNWSLNGDVLTMNGPNGNIELRLQSVDQSQIILVNPNGSLGRSQRC